MNKHIRLVGCIVMLGFTIVLSKTFLTAFLSPGMKVLVAINQYGEAWFELPLILSAVPLAVYTTACAVWDVVSKEKVGKR